VLGFADYLGVRTLGLSVRAGYTYYVALMGIGVREPLAQHPGSVRDRRWRLVCCGVWLRDVRSKRPMRCWSSIRRDGVMTAAAGLSLNWSADLHVLSSPHTIALPRTQRQGDRDSTYCSDGY
jgi:hypothetical protein